MINVTDKLINVGTRVIGDNKIILGNSEPRQPLPVMFPNIRERFLNSRFNFWTPNEIAMAEDKLQYSNGTISEQEKAIIAANISYLTIGDTLVPDNIVNHILPRIKTPELRQYLRWQIAEEANHIESYLYILESLGIDTEGQGKIFNIYQTNEAIAEKVNWNLMNSQQLNDDVPSEDLLYQESLIINLVAYLMFELVFFPAGFSQIFAFARNGKMRNMAQQYTFIWRDEALHADNAAFMLRQLMYFENDRSILNRSLLKRIYNVLYEGFELEMAHIRSVFSGFDIVGYSISDYEKYVKFLINQLCKQLDIDIVFTDVLHNPIPWVLAYQLGTEANFFESRVKEYKVGVSLDFN